MSSIGFSLNSQQEMAAQTAREFAVREVAPVITERPLTKTKEREVE